MLRPSPRISVILPNLNGAAYLSEAIASFLRQDHEPKELIIVDASSTDGSHDIIRAACAVSPTIRWVRLQDSGISDAFTKGYESSTGDLVGFLGADDLLMPGLFGRLSELHQVIDSDGIYFDSYVWWEDERRCILRKPLAPQFTRSSLLRHGTIVGWQNIYFTRAVYDRHQPDPQLRAAMDFELYLRLSLEEPLLVYLEHVGTVNRYGAGNAGGANISRDLDGSQGRELRAIADHYSDGVTTPFYVS